MPEAIPDLVRCPSCGAGNALGALWCGQCLRRFGDEPSPPAAALTLAAGGRPVVQAREDGQAVWSCPACEAENPLEAGVCARCGSAFTSFFTGDEATRAPRTSARAAIAATAALPGAGHWAHHETPAAIARGLLYVWSVGISILLLARPPASARALVRGIGACFALAAAAIWLLSMLETLRLTEGDRRPLIPPKALTWFAAGLSSLLFFGLLGAIIVGR